MKTCAQFGICVWYFLNEMFLGDSEDCVSGISENIILSLYFVMTHSHTHTHTHTAI